VAAATVLSTGAATANAWGTSLPCSTPSTKAVFAKWGDRAQYFRINDGGFESTRTQWALGPGASIVAGNEPLKVAGAADKRSLLLGSVDATAESRTFCIRSIDERIRFFAKPSGPDAKLAVRVEITDPVSAAVVSWDSMVLPQMMTPVGSGWSVSPVVWLRFPDALAWRFGDVATRRNLQLTITFQSLAGTWQLDDVHLDPFRSR
jgi:hypothetical protein